MNAKDLFALVLNKAKEFGLVAKNEGNTIVDPKGNAVIRYNLSDSAYSEGDAFFSFISKEEETQGPFSDFSFTIFPESELGSCLVTLGVGSSGFRNDYQLALLPGLRRTYLKLRTEDDYSFFKTSFADIESTSSDLLAKIRTDYPNLRSVVDVYKTVLPASRIVNFGRKEPFTEPDTGVVIEDTRTEQEAIEEALDIIYIWLATYAKVRGWGTVDQKRLIETYLERIPDRAIPDEEQEVKDLLHKRHYVVLQGAPGTGKTYNALKIASTYNKTFFEQFHAETTYSDFVYGLEPDMNATAGHSQFKPKKGILYQAIEYAIDHPEEKILLIIDEINRANLSNVLGPVFYLFEYQAVARSTKVKIGDLEISELPGNIDVIATMNTADRSLAVVDFALRRRFAWYTLRPHKISPGRGKKFMNPIYKKFEDIFYEYATDDELNLQPGQSYFIVNRVGCEAEMKDRLIYELMPLIKEYLAVGYLLKAKDSFCELFLKTTGKMMYE